MAYTYNGTGTGTMDDPYIPQSCEDLLYTIFLGSNVMKYIKLTMDFDFSSDPQFRGGITEPLNLHNVTCYGDNETNLRKIIGLRITSSCFFFMNENITQGVYKNIFFKDCVFVHDQGSVNAGLVIINSSRSSGSIENCNFSMFCKYTPSVTQALFAPNNLTVKNCCGYFVANDDLSNGEGAFLGLSVLNNCINCSFILHNFSFRLSSIDSQAILSNSKFTSVVLSYPTVPPPNGSYLLVLTYNCTDCSFAIYGNVKPKNSSGLCANLTINNSQNVIFQNDDIYKDLGWNLTAPTNLYKSSLIFRLTTEQMKDLDYLTQIGFTI